MNAVMGLENWSKSTGLKFSNSKTKAVLFTRAHGPLPHLNITLNGNTINFTDNVKYLGVILDNKLTWREHIYKLKKDCQQRLNLLKMLGHQKWGAHRDILLNIYRTTIRAKLDYGSICYGSAKDNLLKCLNPVQNTALRICTGAFRTSPINSLLVEASEMPLDYRRQQLYINYIITLAKNPKNIMYNQIFKTVNDKLIIEDKTILQKRANETMIKLNISLPQIQQTYFEHIPPWLLKKPKIDTTLSFYPKNSTSPATYKQILFNLQNKYCGIKVYTDGSKIDDRTGAAYTTNGTDCHYRLPDSSSNYTAEAFSIFKASEYLKEEEKFKNFMIYTDSLSILQELRKLYSKNVISKKISENFHEAIESGKNIKLIWIPSHIGISGNEKADKLAKEATNNTSIVHIDIPAEDMKAIAKRKLQEKWENEWYTTQNNKLRKIKDTTRPWKFYGIGLDAESRRKQVVITRLRIGHTLLTHGHIFERKDPPLCDVCQVQLTVEHLLIGCRKFCVQRKNCNLPTTIDKALANEEKAIQNTIKFLIDIQLYNTI